MKFPDLTRGLCREIGIEFGSNKFKQFPAYSGRQGRGSRGWFIYPTLRRIQPELIRYKLFLNDITSLLSNTFEVVYLILKVISALIESFSTRLVLLSLSLAISAQQV